MIYGIAGASGTGKTTLGHHVGECLSIPFVRTSITDMARNAGYNAVGELLLPDRILLQNSLLLQFQELLEKTRGPVIFDRTPLDLIAYLYGEIHMHSHKNMTALQMKSVNEYVNACQALTCRYFDSVFVTGILPVYEEVETRPNYNPAYQRHVQLLIQGAILDCPFPLSVHLLGMTDLHERIDFMADTIANRLDEIENDKAERSRKMQIH